MGKWDLESTKNGSIWNSRSWGSCSLHASVRGSIECKRRLVTQAEVIESYWSGWKVTLPTGQATAQPLHCLLAQVLLSLLFNVDRRQWESDNRYDLTPPSRWLSLRKTQDSDPRHFEDELKSQCQDRKCTTTRRRYVEEEPVVKWYVLTLEGETIKGKVTMKHIFDPFYRSVD